jgi:hypothetical protein
MSKKALLVMCLSVCVLLLPAAVSAAAAPNTVAGVNAIGGSLTGAPPDTTASVNANPNGVWPTRTLASANSSAVVAATADVRGCSAGYGCGWIDSQFRNRMGQWAKANDRFDTFGQPNCQEGNWNDCVSAIDNNGTSGYRINWWWDVYQSGNVWRLARGAVYGSLNPDPQGRNANDKFSSDDWG